MNAWTEPDPTTNTVSAREMALTEILSAISRSRDDEAPVFDIILKHACDLCQTPFAGLYLVERTATHAELMASRGARSDYLDRAMTQWPLDGDASVPRAIATGRPVQIEDLTETESYRQRTDQRRVEAVEIEGIRTFLAVPLIDNGIGIGAIGLYRRETRPFDEDQIELLRAFAAQAVIAIGNVRQFRELQSRLEREAATREILEFISRSRDDDEPVFDMITQSALRLSRSWDASLMVVSEDGRTLETVAAHGWDDAIRTYMDANPPKLTDPASTYAQVVISKEPVQIVDIRATDRYRAGTTGRRLAVDQLGLNTMLHVTLVHQGHCL
ncbi:MAG: GAF domain-containing protein, partial [Pseudomonadota bacterium]